MGQQQLERQRTTLVCSSLGDALPFAQAHRMKQQQNKRRCAPRISRDVRARTPGGVSWQSHCEISALASKVGANS